MFLDPRFKLYFENVAEETKRRIIALVTQEEQNNNISAPRLQESEAPKKSIWKDFNSKMANIQPEGTARSRALVEVQRYLDHPILKRESCPLEWWKENRATYPRLYNIAIRRLNAMASSVPCERVFAAAGNILNDRRTRLGCRKLQQLIFLQQNTRLNT